LIDAGRRPAGVYRLYDARLGIAGRDDTNDVIRHCSNEATIIGPCYFGSVGYSGGLLRPRFEVGRYVPSGEGANHGRQCKQ